MTDQITRLDELIAAKAPGGDLRAGFGDLRNGAARYELWMMLGWNDIRQRYRRSVLGPFWITISMGLFIVLLGVIYSRIFNQEIAFFLPYVAMGLISWGLISGTMVESCTVFVEGTSVIKQIRLPYSIYPLRLIWRSLIVFFHTVVLIIPIAIFLHINLGVRTLLVVPGLLLVTANQIWMAIVIGVVSTRFRDLVPLVGTTTQVLMFVTPIMWPMAALGDAHWIAEVNPFHHLIELVRVPLLGGTPEALSYLVVAGMCVLGYAAAAAMLGRANRRLVYWL